jgi:hypothetical protein
LTRKSIVASVVLRSFAALALLLALTSAGAGQERIIAVGDVHGALAQFVNILQRTGVIDASGDWAGKSTILVQVGDATSRGTQSRQCLDLLRQLGAQAGEQNGKVIPLLGNHEVMVIMGDLRYVLAEDFQTFAGEQSATVRERAYEEYSAFLAKRHKHGRADAAHQEAARQKWMDEHPLGFFEFRDAFGPQGLYGRWLRKLDTVAQIGDLLFLMRQEEVLREVQEELAAPGPGEGRRTVEEMQEFLSLQKWATVSPDGPLWYRGYAEEPEGKLEPGLQKIMARLKVRHIVVAHTITASRRISSRFANRVFLIDTGMVFEQRQAGRASALEIQNGQFTAYYSNGEQQVLLRGEGGAAVAALNNALGKRKQQL